MSRELRPVRSTRTRLKVKFERLPCHCNPWARPAALLLSVFALAVNAAAVVLSLAAVGRHISYGILVMAY